jgi:hypothetical protein
VSLGWGPDVHDALNTALTGLRAAAEWRRSAPALEGPSTADRDAVPGASTAVPSEPGPVVMHGREQIVDGLLRQLDRRRLPGRPQVLYGVGGVGKSTIARTVAGRAREKDPRRRVWWISAADDERLSGGLVSLARDLGATTAELELIHAHTAASLGDVVDRVWDLLERVPPGWLLVIDNADDPALLGPPDGTGWIRRATGGLVLITSRDGDEADWPDADLIPVRPLSRAASARVLLDLAPRAGDHDGALALADRLGRMPVALRTAGLSLRQDFASWRTFDGYRRALDEVGVVPVLDGPDTGRGRANGVRNTWELSLDDLARDRLPQARPLLWLLSCFAPGSPVPEELFTGVRPAGRSGGRDGGRHPFATAIAPDLEMTAPEWAEYVRAGLRGLRSVGLVQCPDPDDVPRMIEVHPLIAEITYAVMEDGSPHRVERRPDPALVQAAAAEAVCATALGLDTGNADHWGRFRALTPHVVHLLATTAHRLPRDRRRRLLNAMVRCVASYVWSKAEQRAERLAGKAIGLAHALGCADADVTLRLRHVRALAVREQGRLAEARKSLHEVLAAQLGAENNALVEDALRTRHELGWTIGRLGDWAAAERELTEVLRSRRERLHRRGIADDTVEMLHVRCKLCWCIGRQGRWAEAERAYRELVADRRRILGRDHADTLDTRFNVAKCLAWHGMWADATTEWRRVADDRERALGVLHPDALATRQLEHFADGYVAWRRGDRRALRAAATALKRILDAQTEVRGEDHRDTLETRALLTALRGGYSPGMPWPDDLPRPDADGS